MKIILRFIFIQDLAGYFGCLGRVKKGFALGYEIFEYIVGDFVATLPEAEAMMAQWKRVRTPRR